MKIKVVIADTNIEYVSRLMRALEAEDNLSLSMFSDKKAFENAVSVQKYDIVIADPSMVQDTGTYKNVKLFILLHDEEYQGDKRIYERYRCVRKYQRASSLYKEALGYFAEVAAATYSYSMNKKCNVIGVYSPIGGSGKTTVALSIADSLASRGSRCIYISFESISSYGAVIELKGSKGIGEIFSSVDANINYEMKIESLIRKTEKGLMYFEDFENLLDIYEITSEDIEKVISRISASGLCEYIVIDMSTEFNKINRDIMELADKIAVVETTDMLGAEKIRRMFARRNILRNYEEKMQVILNKTSRSSTETGLEIVGRIGVLNGTGSDIISAVSRSMMIDIERVIQ